MFPGTSGTMCCQHFTNQSVYININGLVQERLDSIADILELHLSCTIPLIYGTVNQSLLCALAHNDAKSSADTMPTTKLNNSLQSLWTRAGCLSPAWSKLRLCSANQRAGYFSNLACDWLSIVWAYSKQKTENGPWWCHSKLLTWQPMTGSHDIVWTFKCLSLRGSCYICAVIRGFPPFITIAIHTICCFRPSHIAPHKRHVHLLLPLFL